jgi:cytochrome c
MKKILLFPGLVIFLMSCGSGSSSTPAPEANVNDITKNPVYQKGIELIGKNDCLTCHNVENKINGPAYRDVANKYAGMSDTIITHLANKIISGGTGVWGEIPMTPHPSLQKEDAEAIVRYILLLKN